MSSHKPPKSLDDWVDEIHSDRDVHQQAARLHRLQNELQLAKDRERAFAQELEAAKARVAFASGLESAPTHKPIRAPRGKGRGKRTATAFALASDWHLEEVVDSQKVSGRNEYNPDIARARAGKFFSSTAWMIRHHSKTWEIPTLVLWLGGDLISGYIHDELQESNALSPLETALMAMDLVCGGIDYLGKEFPDMRLVVPCNHGNHGRMHIKPRIKTSAENNLEWLLYQFLARKYESDERVDFQVSRGRHSHLEVYDWVVHFAHGDDTRYNGGIGGLGIPLRKAVDRWNDTRHAHLNVFGHWHQLGSPHPDIVTNGSLIGFSEYSYAIKASFEHPRQGFFLLDSTRGLTQLAPLYVTDEGSM